MSQREAFLTSMQGAEASEGGGFICCMKFRTRIFMEWFADGWRWICSCLSLKIQIDDSISLFIRQWILCRSSLIDSLKTGLWACILNCIIFIGCKMIRIWASLLSFFRIRMRKTVPLQLIVNFRMGQKVHLRWDVSSVKIGIDKAARTSLVDFVALSV
jgi:hypothetical protein